MIPAAVFDSGEPRKETHVIPTHLRTLTLATLVAFTVTVPSGAQGAGTSHVATAGSSFPSSLRQQNRKRETEPSVKHHPCRTRACITFHHHKRHRSRFTGYKVEGRTSTFGYLTGDSEGQTADGGTTARPCIAIRNDATLDHYFEVTILGHHARLIQCDWGPASWTGRAIDVTGLGDRALRFSPASFPTGAWGVARELR